jgi:hypothetical protein
VGERVVPSVAVLVVLWGLLYLPNLVVGRTLPARDLAATYGPWQAVWRAQVRHGHAPIWDPCSNHGRLAWADPDVMAAYPGTAILSLLPLESAVAWHVALHHLLFILGCFYLARRTGADPGAAAVGAAAAATCGVAFSTTIFLPHPAALAWSPWALATAVQPPSSPVKVLGKALSGGSLLGLIFLTGDPVAAGLVAAAWVVVALSLWRRQHWWGVAVAGPVAFAFAAPLLIPLILAFPDTVRGALGVGAGSLSLDTLAPRRFPELFFPHLLGTPLGDGHTGFWAATSFPWQRYYPTIFLGSAALLTLPFARAARRDLRIWWVLFIGGVAGSILLSVGVVEAAACALPFVQFTRFGIKLLLPATVALAPLIAAGWVGLRRRWRRWGRRAAGIAVALSILVSTLAVQPRLLLKPILGKLYPESRADLERTSDAALRRGLFTDTLALAIPPAVAVILGPSAIPFAIATFTANALAGHDVLAWDSGRLWAHPPLLVDALPSAPTIAVFITGARSASRPGQDVLSRFWAPRAALLPEYGVRWGIRYVLDDGPNGLEPLRHELLAAVASRTPLSERARVAAALGADAVICDAPIPGWTSEQVNGVWVNTTDRRAPSAYLANQSIAVRDLEGAAQVMAADEFQPGRDAVVEGAWRDQRWAGGTVHELAGSPSHRVFAFDSNGPGLLVVQQSYMSCWRAESDGRRVPVGPVNGASIGVLVPRGSHTVAVFVDPTPYWLGLCGPLLVLGAALGVWRSRVVGRRGVTSRPPQDVA